MIHYDLVKKLAKQIGRSTKDLIALAPANDPFYAGCPFRARDAEWFANVWEGYGFPHGVHLRRIHYVLVSKSQTALCGRCSLSWRRSARCHGASSLRIFFVPPTSKRRKWLISLKWFGNDRSLDFPRPVVGWTC